MPSDFVYSNPVDQGRRRAAWAAHYVAKGCSTSKAEEVAWRKVRQKATWPPA